MQMSISVVAQNTCSTVGEGPVWIAASQSVLYVDIMAGDVHVWNSSTGQDTKTHIEGDDPIGFIIPYKSGGHVAGVGRTLSKVDLETGKVVSILAEVEQGTKNRINDGKCDSSGRVWAGTMGKADPSGIFPPGVASLYSLDSQDSGITKQLGNITLSNGLAWSSDNNTMFYIDTPTRSLFAFDFDLQKGTIANQRVLVDFNKVGPASEVGNPDGMCIDSEDNLWVACFGGGRVICFNSSTGQEIRQVSFPQAKQITSCCFGGPDYADLYVTSARLRMSEEEFAKNQPMAGSLFKVTSLGVKGLPPSFFSG